MEQAIQIRKSIAFAAGVLLIAASLVVQKGILTIKNAIHNSAKLRVATDRCDTAQTSGEAHFTGCSSIL